MMWCYNGCSEAISAWSAILVFLCLYSSLYLDSAGPQSSLGRVKRTMRCRIGNNIKIEILLDRRNH